MAVQPSPSTGPQPEGAYTPFEQLYEHDETRALVNLVDDAAELVRGRGEEAFAELGRAGGRWRHDDTYVFVLDREGNMLVHPDAALEGTNQIGLRDVDGKPIIRGLIDAAAGLLGKAQGWYHYRWPEPGGLLPRWKSSFVKLVEAPSGMHYLVGAGVYDERMERAFVIDAVMNAAGQIERLGPAAMPLLRDPSGPFVAKDAYVFVLDMHGVELVNPAFPSLEGRNVLDVTDAQGRYCVRDMIRLVRTRGAGWIDYVWPRPGQSAPALKSTFVTGARLGERTVVVGCGVYLADAPTLSARDEEQRTPAELEAFVRDAAALLDELGPDAYPQLRTPGSRWFHDDTYCFVFTPEGIREFHAADPESEGQNDTALVDVLGRPIARMILEVAGGPSGEGWAHYMYPRPGDLFPTWKSVFVKRVTYPGGAERVVGSGLYNMTLDRRFIEDLVDHAAALVGERGRDAFPRLRDETGPFRFMDTYVFVLSKNGTELVNGGLPALEGRNLMEHRDLSGRPVIRDEIMAALQRGSAWLDMWWYRPGAAALSRKSTYVRRVDVDGETFVVGSGLYVD